MEAKEFFKEWNRMCDYMGDGDDVCENCIGGKMEGFICCTYELSEDDINIIVDEVEKWSKEHPRKTYRDVFLEAFPNARKANDGLPVTCLSNVFGLEHSPITAEESCTGYSCEKCWNREYREDK